MKFQRYKPQYEFIKRGKTFVRVEKIVNKWNGQKPEEPEIKNPTD